MKPSIKLGSDKKSEEAIKRDIVTGNEDHEDADKVQYR